MEDPLNNKFNIVVPKADPVGDLLAETSKDNAVKDFGASRSSMASVMDIGTRAMENLADLAFQSQDAEAYEALAKMIKAMSDAAKTSMIIHKIKEELVKPQDNTTPGQLHNHIHLPMQMSTFELKAALKAIKGEEE